MRVSDDPGNSGQLGDLLRRTLRVTTRNENTGRRIIPMRTSNRMAHIVVCVGSYRASVQHDEILRPCVSGGAIPASLQDGANRGSIGLRSPASEVLYDKLLHDGNILAATSSRSPRGTQPNSE